MGLFDELGSVLDPNRKRRDKADVDWEKARDVLSDSVEDESERLEAFLSGDGGSTPRAASDSPTATPDPSSSGDEHLAAFVEGDIRDYGQSGPKRPDGVYKAVLSAMNGGVSCDKEEALESLSMLYSSLLQMGKLDRAADKALWVGRTHELLGETGDALAWYGAAARIFDQDRNPDHAALVRTEVERRKLDPTPMQGGWVCSGCGSGNPRSAEHCLACHRRIAANRPPSRVVAEARSASAAVDVPTDLLGVWIEATQSRIAMEFGSDAVVSLNGRAQGVLRPSGAGRFTVDTDRGPMDCTFRIEGEHLYITGLSGAGREMQFRRQ